MGLDVESHSSRKLLDADVPDAKKPNNFWPMYGNGFIYFVSDRDVKAKAGSPVVMESRNNIWKMPAEGGDPVQVTKHSTARCFGHPCPPTAKSSSMKRTSVSGSSTLPAAKRRNQSRHVPDEKENNLETVLSSSEADSYNLSPSGKRAVIATQGELFTIATDRGDVRRLTQTSDVREAQPQWSPDGKRIAFVSDRSGREEDLVCDEHGDNLKTTHQHRTQKTRPSGRRTRNRSLYTASDRALHRYNLADNKEVS